MPIKTHIASPSTGVIATVEKDREGDPRLHVEAALNPNTPISAEAQTGSYPDPSSADAGEAWPVTVDAFGNLIARSTVLTDEGSFRDDFSGSSLFTTLSGTITVVAGKVFVTGVGTKFKDQIRSGDFIKASADSESGLTEVDEVLSDTRLILSSGYAGTSQVGAGVVSHWGVRKDAGTSEVVGASLLDLVATTTNGSIIGVLRRADYLPFTLTTQLYLSQRIANQQTVIGFQDTAFAPEAQAVFVFDGTDNTKVRCRTAFAGDSLQETIVTLPGGVTSAASAVYDIDVSPDEVSFAVNNSVVASHKLHLPEPYTPLEIAVYIENTGTAGSATTLHLDMMFWQNTDMLQVGSAFNTNAISVQGSTNGVPVQIAFGTPGGGLALPKMIDLVFNVSEGAIVAQVFKRVLTYTVPVGYSGYLIKYTSFQGEAAISRVVAETNMAQLSIVTNTFTAGTAYGTVQFAGTSQAEVVTALSAGSGNVVVTVTYTNDQGVGSRTGTITIPKGSAIGSRWDVVLQAGDLGIKSVQNMSVTPTLAAGSIKLLGFVQLAYHQDQSTTTQTETQFAPGAITFPTGTVLGIEYAGGTVSKTRNFDTLIQLVS